MKPQCKATYLKDFWGVATLTHCITDAHKDGFCRKHSPKKAISVRRDRIRKARELIKKSLEEIKSYKKLLRVKGE